MAYTLSLSNRVSDNFPACFLSIDTYCSDSLIQILYLCYEMCLILLDFCYRICNCPTLSFYLLQCLYFIISREYALTVTYSLEKVAKVKMAADGRQV